MNIDKRFEIFCHMLEELDHSVYLIDEYDKLLHDYNGEVMFQAESQMIKTIGDFPGITASQISKKFGKSTSSSSQIIRKLKNKGWVRQTRNELNSREYNLFLTEAGKGIYDKHRDFEQKCYNRTFEMLSDVTNEEMESYIKIQKRLNKSFEIDVEESKNI